MNDTERKAYDLLIEMTNNGTIKWQDHGHEYRFKHGSIECSIFHSNGDASILVMHIGSEEVMSPSNVHELYSLARSTCGRKAETLLSEWVESTTKLMSEAKS